MSESLDPRPTPDRSLAGSRFGGYEILEELGSGGMGRVYRARDLTLDRVVALKTLAVHLSADEGFVHRFLKEARLAASLNHPNIVHIYSFGCVEGTYYLAMEFVDGHSLGHYLRHRHFSETDAILIVRHAARALAVAHAEGLVHRDIKPDNLMLTGHGEVKLVDLGIAKRLDEDQAITMSGQTIGTPHYISPEQIRGQRDIDRRADIYSLGATLYHLVTGHTPFSGASGPLVMSMHLAAPLPEPRRYEPGLSEGLCRIIRKMMAKDREDRYADAYALDVDLYRLQSGESPEAEDPGGPVPETMVEVPAQGGAAPGPPATFDSALLARIEENLAASIGPMARVIVRKTARTAPNLDALCTELARQLAPGDDRDAFCEKCMACGRGSKTPATPTKPPTGPHGAHATPARSTPARPAVATAEETATLEAELAKQIGPLARIIVKQALKEAASLADLVSALEENIPGDERRRAFRAAVRPLRH